jgi:hypothetical protein
MARLTTLLLFFSLFAASVAISAPGFPPHFPSFYVKQAFLVPSGAIDCNAGPIIDAKGRNVPGRFGLDCVIFSRSTVKGQATWYMSEHGHAYYGRVPANIAADRLPHLGYGKTWSAYGFSCHSAKSGLTCQNRSGHGFFLSVKQTHRF